MEELEIQETLRLVKSAQAGDEVAVDGLFRRYYPITCKIVAARMGVRLRELVDHEDIVQAVLFKAFRDLDAFEYRREGAFRHYLCRMVENELATQWRKATAEKRGGGVVRNLSALESSFWAESILGGDTPTPSAQLRGRELEERLEEALLELDERQRRVFLLHHPTMCDLPHAAVAEEMEINSEGTVRSLYSRALIRLADLISEGPGR